MQQINSSDYNVAPGETVTIVTQPLNGVIPEAIQAFRMGMNLPNIGGATPTFRFTASAPLGGAETISILVNFPGADDTARVTTQVLGAPGPGPTFLKTDSVHQKSLFFNVVAPVSGEVAKALAIEARRPATKKPRKRAAKRTRKAKGDK
jgi:hypothetical protein